MSGRRSRLRARSSLSASVALVLALMPALGWARSPPLGSPPLLGTPPLSGPPVRAASPPATAPRVVDGANPAGVVNLNDAGEDELRRLPGVGAAKARAILEHRHAHPFRRADELVRVRGFGRKTYGRLRPYLTLVGPSTLREKVGRR